MARPRSSSSALPITPVKNSLPRRHVTVAAAYPNGACSARPPAHVDDAAGESGACQLCASTARTHHRPNRSVQRCPPHLTRQRAALRSNRMDNVLTTRHDNAPAQLCAAPRKAPRCRTATGAQDGGGARCLGALPHIPVWGMHVNCMGLHDTCRPAVRQCAAVSGH
eukprot:364565-Chlamydomonas_euryale.AAC.1